MSLDAKYRPHRYEDVLGQEVTISVLREYVRGGTGYQQSYLFAGQHGSGKTTLGRILARALLCENPANGDPCDSCSSCLSILEGQSSDCFIEIDAATNSGKEDVKRILEEIEYSTFSGKRRIYLFDESHQLTKSALDGLLKPMEDEVEGSSDKRLVCIFCTTEPAKMRATVLSRCAPAFVIRAVEPEKIGERLAHICKEEGLKYESEALVQIAEITKCHIRDALKAVEGVSKIGPVDKKGVAAYLHLDLNNIYADVVSAIGSDPNRIIELLKEIFTRVSPVSCYEKLAEVSLLAFQHLLGAGKPSPFWDVDKLENLGQTHGQFLLDVAQRLSNRPGRPTSTMLFCDLLQLHREKSTPVRIETIQALAPHIVAQPIQARPKRIESVSPVVVPQANSLPALEVTEDGLSPLGVYNPAKAINRELLDNIGSSQGKVPESRPSQDEDKTYSKEVFSERLLARFKELVLSDVKNEDT